MAAEVCAIAFTAAPGRICLVTDAAACAGMPPGRYLLGGEPIILPPGDGVPPVRPDGTLAGSALRMDAAVANMVTAGAGLADAVAAATRVPADLIGRPELGRIAPGAAADLVWLDDDLRTLATWVDGDMVYSAAAEAATMNHPQRQPSVSDREPDVITHMRTEIGEQPAALRATLDALLPRTAEVAAVAEGTRQVLFIARGTSDNAAVYGSYLLQVYAGRLATLASPSVATTYRSRDDLSGVLAVALSQSGRTEEIVETLSWAADCGARTIAVTNSAQSPLAAAAELALVTEAGAERAVPATKTFVTQLAALAVLGVGLGADLDPDELRRVPGEIERMLAEPGDIEGAAAALAGAAAWWYRAAASPTRPRSSSRSSSRRRATCTRWDCRTRICCTGRSRSWTPIPRRSSWPPTPARRWTARSGWPGGSPARARPRWLSAAARPWPPSAARALPGPRLPEWLAPIGLIVPGQLLTEALARQLGLNPDSPRGLSKVTQTG